MIDRDLPDEVREIDTPAVLEALPAHLHELVWRILQEQLHHARTHGAAGHNHARPEDAARAGALAVRWLEDEMRSAFPERAGQLDAVDAHDAWATPYVVPDTPAELLALMPRPAGRVAQMPFRGERALVEVEASPPASAGSQQLVLVLVAGFGSGTDPDADPFAAPRGSIGLR